MGYTAAVWAEKTLGFFHLDGGKNLAFFSGFHVDKNRFFYYNFKDGSTRRKEKKTMKTLVNNAYICNAKKPLDFIERVSFDGLDVFYSNHGIVFAYIAGTQVFYNQETDTKTLGFFLEIYRDSIPENHFHPMRENRFLNDILVMFC